MGLRWLAQAQRDCQVSAFTRGWPYGRPLGTMNHCTAGCGDPCGTYKSRNVSAHFTVQQNARLVKKDGGGYQVFGLDQHVSLDNYAWHAHSASRRYFGIEVVSYPGSCGVTENQLEVLAWLNAKLLDIIEKKYNVKVPTRRAAGCSFTSGIKCHADGLESGCSWNPNRHWDAPFKTPNQSYIPNWDSPWTDTKFVKKVQEFRSPPKTGKKRFVKVRGDNIEKKERLRGEAEDILHQFREEVKGPKPFRFRNRNGTMGKRRYSLRQAKRKLKRLKVGRGIVTKKGKGVIRVK